MRKYQIDLDTGSKGYRSAKKEVGRRNKILLAVGYLGALATADKTGFDELPIENSNRKNSHIDRRSDISGTKKNSKIKSKRKK